MVRAYTVGPESVDDAFHILSSGGCRAASWHLSSICNSGLATDSSVALGVVFTNGSHDPEVGVCM